MVERRHLPASTARGADLAGVASAVALAAWTILAGGRSAPIVLLLMGLVAAVAAGRALATWPGLVPKAVATAIAGATLLTYPGIRGAGGAPTGYANSNATLAAVGVLAATAAARHAPPGRERQAWTALAVGLAALVVLTRSTAGVLTLVVVGALLLAGRRRPVLVAAGGAIATALLLAVTVAMAVDGSTPLASSDLVRVELWSAAVDVAQEEPVQGSGGGAFEARNPVTTDDDLRWVHHEYLELAVELGGVGLVLVVALGLAVLVRLAATGQHGVIGAAAVTVVALHGTVDHVWHAPAVLLVVALLVGDGTGSTSGGTETTVRGSESGGLGLMARCP